MATHLRRADEAIRAAMAALNPANAATYAAVGHLVEARDHLSRIDAGDVARHLEEEVCHARTGKHSHCGDPAAVIEDGEGRCAHHACRCSCGSRRAADARWCDPCQREIDAPCEERAF
jgi:hypothetical protein